MPKIQLTQSFVKKVTCPVDKSRIEFCDTAFPGLYLEARATSPGQGTFYLRYKNTNGKTCHQKLGRTHELTLGEARKRAKVMKAEILLGADPRAEAIAKKNVMTFSAFMHERYLPYIKVRKRSCRNDISMLRLRLSPTFGEFPLNRITRSQIQTFHTALRDEGLSPAHCDHHIKVLRYALNLAVDWELLDKNPAAKVPLFKEDNKMERYMTDEQQGKLLQVLRTDKNRPICLLIFFLLSTGARLNEALKATWCDIEVDTGVWRIPATNAKSKKLRAVPLNDTALQVLRDLRGLQGDGDYQHLFINPRTGKRYVNINKTWYRIREAADLPKLRLHDLRHQFASHLVNDGKSLFEVQQILGHSDPTVTMRYAHLSVDSMRSAAESAARSLGDVG